MCRSLQELTAELMDSYARVGGINHIEGINLPSKEAVASIIRILLDLLFPGFYHHGEFRCHDLPNRIEERLEKICLSLGPEIAKSLEFTPTPGARIGSYVDEGIRIARELLGDLSRIRNLLSMDVKAAFDGDPAAKTREEIILAYPGLEAIAVQRIAHELHIRGVDLIPRMMTEWAHARTGIDIHPGANIGTHFFIDHGTGVVIGETCDIGNHVKMYHGVTLGARSTFGGQSLRGKKRHPTIRDYVTIYPNATILGGETEIGEGSTIAGNVFLLESVPPYSRVSHEPHSLLIRPRESPRVASMNLEAATVEINRRGPHSNS
jgi:serine O-acetyltransferase